ncbi:MAG: prolyl oligopeptidase family serine peptidase [Ignavibacteriae bacterium]|nr:prolyl oligopeptidase family serine peptidase [Ignavibacteria bacterium]MBI3365794.1 prolyl oligopeptidase family serine peptidase [Ignavibacteriota bacterium]
MSYRIVITKDEKYSLPFALFTLRFLVIAMTALLISRSSSFAQRHDSIFQTRTFFYGNKQSMPYGLFVPRKYDARKKYPLVVWLHGAVGRGYDNRKNISDGNEPGSHVWTRDPNQEKYPCFVVAPQCPDTSYWVSNDGIDNPPDQLDAVVALLKELRRRYSIDTNRMYVAGQSMGGVATWEIVSRYPSMFAAALPLCGIGNLRNAPKLTRLAIWAFHGDADDVIPVVRTREMVDSIRRAGGYPKFTEYKGVGHDVWNSVFKEPDLVAWVFAQRRKN